MCGLVGSGRVQVDDLHLEPLHTPHKVGGEGRGEAGRGWARAGRDGGKAVARYLLYELLRGTTDKGSHYFVWMNYGAVTSFK